jgi:tetratricopeptide (TPR) repeat protein
MPDRRRLHPIYDQLPPEFATIFPTDDDALDWLGAELDMLLTAQQAALQIADHCAAWGLVEGMWSYLIYQRQIAAWRQAATAGVRAAQADGSDRPVGRLLLFAGQAELRAGDQSAAMNFFQQADHLAVQIDDVFGQTGAAEHIAIVHLEQRDPGAALQTAQRGIDLHDLLDPPHQRGLALLLRVRGRARTATGDHDGAHTDLADALAIFSGLDDTYLIGQTGVDLAEHHLAQHQPEQALTLLDQASALLQGRAVIARLWTSRAAAYRQLADHAVHQALTHCRDLGMTDEHPDVRALLDQRQGQ